MRRVAITGLGAVTPLGPRRAVDVGRRGLGAQRRRLDRGVRRLRVPGADRRRGARLRPGRARPPEGGAADGPERPARRRRGAGGLGRRGRSTGLSTARASGSSSARRSAGSRRSSSSSRCFAERGPDRVSPFFIPSVLVDTASGQIAIQLGITGPNYAPVSACATGSTAIGEAAESIRRGAGRRRARRRHRGADHPLILAGFCAMRGLVAEEEDPTLRVAPVRRDARRLRHGGGRVHPRARGARGGAGARARRSTRRCSGTAPRTTRTTWPRPSRRRPASREMMQRGARRRRRRARAGRATSTRTAPRRRSATSPRRGRSSRSSATTPTDSPSRRRSR